MINRLVLFAALLSVVSINSSGFSQTFESGITRRVAELTNEYRQKNGLKPLRYNPKIEWAADILGREMAKQNTLGHRVDGQNAGQRLNSRNYSWVYWGENVAFASPRNSDEIEAQNLVNRWINSSGHRKNMLNPQFLEFGVSVFRSKHGGLYAVQKFAIPAEYKDTSDVWIYNYSFSDMYVFDDQGFNTVIGPFQEVDVRLRSESKDKLPTVEIYNGIPYYGYGQSQGGVKIVGSGSKMADDMGIMIYDMFYLSHGIASNYHLMQFFWK